MLCNTYTQIKITKQKNRNLVIIKFALSITVQYVKPGSTTNELNETAKDEVRKLSHEDAIIICSGTNDYELNKFSQTFHNTMSFIKNK